MNQETPTDRPETPRIRLVRRAAVLQLKLIADGMRDAALIPISLVAALIGLIRGGENADREFEKIIKLGRRSERWINLFDHHRPLARSHPAGSMDTLIARVEEVLREQVGKGTARQELKEAIEQVLDEAEKDRRE